MFLADYVLVQIFFYHSRLGHVFETYAAYTRSLAVLRDDIMTQFNTFRTNIHLAGAFYERVGLSCRSAAETTYCLVFFRI